MRIPQKTWKKFVADLRKVSDKAAEELEQFMDTHRDADGLWNARETRRSIINYAFALATKYGEGAGEIACQMYDAVGVACGVSVPLAEPAATATYGEVAKTVNGVMLQSNQPSVMGSAVGRLVKMTGVDTTMQNAIRDGAEWAWIPSGDSCPFCRMLAANGWKRASKNAIKNGHAEHIHANCDCTYAIRFDESSTVAGYDPDALYEEYQQADGRTMKEKANSIRREDYKKNKDEINAQKRLAYARRKEVETAGQ